jgi:two-component system sensor histidine kinase RegB
LAKLRNLGNDGGDPFAAVPLTDLLAEVMRPHEGHGKRIELSAEHAIGPAPVFERSVGMLYGLGNLIENAADFASASVLVAAAWDRDSVSVTITDDGPGFAPELIARLGEPYLTSRPREAQGSDPTQPGGLGLGVFIAKTLLERTGGRIAFENTAPNGHARVSIVWPRSAVEAV